LTQIHLVGQYYLKDDYLLQFWQPARFHSISTIFKDYIGNYLYNVHFYLWGAELPLAFVGGFGLIFIIVALFGYSIRTICYVGRWMVGVILLAWVFTQFVFIDRLGLFFIPIFILLYSSACKSEKSQKISLRIRTALLLLPLAFPVFWSIRNLTVLQDPIMKCRQPLKLVLKEIDTQIRDQDLIFVFSPTRYAFDYHTRLWKVRPQIIYGDTLEDLPILFHGKIYFVITYTADREKMSPILKAAEQQRGNLRLISAHSSAEIFVSEY